MMKRYSGCHDFMILLLSGETNQAEIMEDKDIPGKNLNKAA